MTSLRFLTFVFIALPGAWCIRPQVEETTTLNYTAVEGRTAILPCRVRDLGRHKVKVVWADMFTTTLTFKDKRVIDDKRFSVSTNHKNEWNLRLERVKLSDTGGYVCTVNTQPPIKHLVKLTVVVPPSISQPAEDSEMSVPEFDKVTLTCKAEGTPEPTITWKRQTPLDTLDSSSTSCEHRKNVKIGSGEILIIHNTSRECGGIYYCEAESEVQPSAKRKFNVKVEFAPEIHLANDRLGQALGKETVLECTISGRPTSQVYWVFQGRQIDKANYERKKYQVEVYEPEDAKVVMLLYIYDIQPEDFGEYTCVGKNNMGRAESKMTLHEHKTRTRAPPTTTVPTTTSRPKRILAGPQQPPYNGRSSSGQIPKGRAGAGYNRHGVIDTGYGGSGYNQRAGPAAASSHRDGKNSSPALLLISNRIFIAVAVLLVLFYTDRIHL